MTHPALILLSLALAACVIGLARLRCRARRAEANAAYWREAYEGAIIQRDKAMALPVFGALDVATMQDLAAEISRRTPVGCRQVVVVWNEQAMDAEVAPYWLDDRDTLDLLCRAIEKVEEAA